MAGRVLNRAGLALPRATYDTVVVGGGLLGLACAFYLRVLQPEASLVVVEQDGVPSEAGATFASPALVQGVADAAAQSEWALHELEHLSRVTGISRPHDVPFQPVGLLKMHGTEVENAEPTESLLETLRPEQARAARALVEVSAFPYTAFEKRGGYGSAEAAALYYGHGAVARGADLMLNTRAVPLSATEFKLERLEYDRTMARIVAKVETLRAENVVVAAGASTVRVVEDALGVVLPYRLAYRQYPRLEADARLPLKNGRVDLPVLQAGGFSLRPQGEGLLVVPPTTPPDPDGYEPTGARLMGVRVGVRREVLELLLAHTESIPAFGWESFNLGKTVNKVRGAWEVLTPTGRPQWQTVEKTSWHALVGGEHGFDLGLATAYEIAATLAGRKKRPWL